MQFDRVNKKTAYYKYPYFYNESVHKKCLDIGMEMDVKLNKPD